MVETPALKLYHAPASPNSRHVRMFLAEERISVPLVSVDLAALRGDRASAAAAAQYGRPTERGRES
jgi:glutathione S-transferase